MKDRLDKILDQIEDGRLEEKMKEEKERKELAKTQLMDLMIDQCNTITKTSIVSNNTATIYLTPDQFNNILKAMGYSPMVIVDEDNEAN